MEAKHMEFEVTYENYKEEVEKSDKPVLLYFWAEWCGPCRMIDPIISQIVEEYESVLKVGKVHYDEDMRLAMKFGVMSIPMMVLVKNGEAAATSFGFQPKATLETNLGLNELKYM